MPLSSQLPRLWLIILVFVIDIHPDVFPVDTLGVLVCLSLLAAMGLAVCQSEKCVDCKQDDFVSHSFLLGCCLDYSPIIILIGYLSSPSPLYFVFYFANRLTG